ncbi:MAG: hypothetical protein U0X91_00580 [Spirosomataceae bacterium]
MAIIISVLALLATFYQLYLQRVHNEKSLRPLGQIDLRDRNKLIALYLTNNGMGPMLIDKITFFKEGKSYSTIEECLRLGARAYRRISISESGKKVILPSASLEVFAAELETHEGEAALENVRTQLSPLTLKVAYRDIYENKFTLEQNLDWFARHITDERE